MTFEIKSIGHQNTLSSRAGWAGHHRLLPQERWNCSRVQSLRGNTPPLASWQYKKHPHQPSWPQINLLLWVRNSLPKKYMFYSHNFKYKLTFLKGNLQNPYKASRDFEIYLLHWELKRCFAIGKLHCNTGALNFCHNIVQLLGFL